jgi:hypothetical protein
VCTSFLVTSLLLFVDIQQLLSYALAVAFCARKERESGGVESVKDALNTPVSPRFGAEVLLRRLV